MSSGTDHPGLGEIQVNSVRVTLDEIWESDCRAIYEHWDNARGDKPMPAWSEFELSRLPADCIRYTHVVDVLDDPFDIRFRFWGTGLTDVLYFDRTGDSLLTTNMGYLEENRRHQVLADYQEVISGGMPLPFLWDASSARERPSRLIVPSLRLPLAEDGTRVTQVVTHFDFTVDRDKWEDMFYLHQRQAQAAAPPRSADNGNGQ